MVFRESFISRRLSRASVMGRLGPFFPLDEATLAKMGSLARTRSNCLSLLTLLDEGAAACPPPAAAPALASRVALVCRRRHSFTAQVQAPRRFAQEFVMIVQGVGGRDRMESIRQIFGKGIDVEGRLSGGSDLVVFGPWPEGAEVDLVTGLHGERSIVARGACSSLERHSGRRFG